ncbi:non-ribosomal peptide synthetase [Burkholderia pseudomallei]|uniref:non-ribosomal peptide synthetase n=2 Tax=Burkholderia pseudomallei TaxID=28450 RepID=UPI000C9A1C06|nr:non-ribosomal peptide synthetase [Burkholderia pseudomallei]
MTTTDLDKMQQAGTIVHVLQRHAGERPDALAYHFIESPETGAGPQLTYRQLDERARRVAAYLRQHANENDRVLLFFPPGLEYIAAFLGCLYAGVIAVPLYPPRRGEKLDRIAHVVRDCGARFAFGDGEAVAKASEWFSGEMGRALSAAISLLSIDAAADVPPIPASDYRRTPADVAFLQYTSGSTGEPKGVAVSHGNLIANQIAIAAGFGSRDDDVCLNWLPLYHDMGLIGTTLHPLFYGYPSHIMSPTAFIKDPLSWLENITRFRATVAGGPDFGYRLCAEHAARSPERVAALDLSSWRIAFNGAEPVQAESMRRFAQIYARARFDPRAFYPCYGLAEATLFVTGGAPGGAFHARAADRFALTLGRLEPQGGAASVELVSSGRCAAGHELRIVNDLREAAQGEIGEIWVRGPSIPSGYWNKDAVNADVFRARLAAPDPAPSGFLRTGDLGCVVDGELFVTGRSKDVVIVNGRNYYPQDLEAAAGASDPALREGCTAAFSIDGEGDARVVVVQEVDRRFAKTIDVDAAARAIRTAISRACDVAVDEIVFIQPASIPKTSSGKIRRRETRARYLDGTLLLVGRDVRSASGAGAASDQDLDALWPQAARSGAVPADEPAARIVLALRRAVAALTGQTPEAIGADLPLAGAGLNSIGVVRLQGLIEKHLGAQVGLDDLFGASSIAELGAQIARTDTAAPAAPRATAGAKEREFALSPNQQQLWFLHQFDPDRHDYNLALLIECRPALASDALEASVARACARHPILRTRYRAEDSRNVQTVEPTPCVDFAEIDPQGLDDAALIERFGDEALRPFDLERGAALRIRVAQRDGGRTWLLVNLHHIASDFWSMSQLVEEIVSDASGGEPIADPERDYQDWCRERDAYTGSAAALADRQYWRSVLGENRADSALASVFEPSAQRAEGAADGAPRPVNFRIGETLAKRVEAFARRSGRTLNAVYLAAFQLLLHRRGAAEHLAIGTLAAGRTHWAYARTQGYFVNPLALHTAYRDDTTFAAFLSQSADNLTAAIAHQAYPFAHLVNEHASKNRAGRHPFFQALFVMQQSSGRRGTEAFAIKGVAAEIEIGSITARSLPLRSAPSQFDLALTMAPAARGIEAMLEYGETLATRDQVAAFADEYLQLLDAVLDAADAPLHTIEPKAAPAAIDAPAAERAADLPAAAVPLAQCDSLIEGFEQQVRSGPQRVALTYGESSLTYRELDERATQLARALAPRMRADGPTTAALLLHRGVDVVVSILAILKAGGTYVPLDPHSPAERLGFILEDAQPSVLVTSTAFGDLLGKLPSVEGRTVLLVDALAEPARDGAHAADRAPQAARALRRDDCAYVIFTSGTTGRPKGVQVTHDNVLCLFTSSEPEYRFDERDVWTLFHSIAFDISVWEMWGALLYGGRIVGVPYEISRSPDEFRALCARERVTVLNQTPSAFKYFIAADLRRDDRLSALRLVIFGGETLVFGSLKDWFRKYGDAQPLLVNMYGITEITVHGTYRPVTLADLDAPGSMIGLPLRDLSIVLLDEDRKPVVDGEVGEIYVGGRGVALGYLRNETLTRERFVDLDIEPGVGVGRYYKSGDLARKVGDADYEYLGRKDQQVKINGFRIELGEIEAALTRFDGIRDAVTLASKPHKPRNVVAPASADGGAGAITEIRQLIRAASTPQPDDEQTRLVSYIVCDALPDVQALYRHLSERIPDYMMPSAVLPIDAIPLNQNGKVDAKALMQRADGAIPLRAAYVAPRTDEEKLLCKLYAEVLEKPRVGANDGFFELGGDSIRIIQLRSRALKAGLQISVQDVFRLQTPAALAAVTKISAQLAERPRVAAFAQTSDAERRQLPEDAVDAYPLARLQEGLLFHSQFGDDIAMYCDIFEFRLRARYDLRAFEQALAALIERHPIFRTSFHLGEFERPLQIVHAHSAPVVDVFDYRDVDDARRKQRYEAWLDGEKRRPYDVARAPLLRFSLHRWTDDEFVFTMSFHDALLDGWSESSAVSEILRNYVSLVGDGALPQLPELHTRFSDYVSLEQETVADPAVRAFWEAELEDFRPTRLAYLQETHADAGRNPMRFYAVDVPAALSNDLKALAARLGVSLKHVLLAAHASVMSFVSGESDVVLAVESNGRLEDGDGERVLGTHLNVVPWRVQLGGDTWSELVKRIHDKESALQAYRRYPYQEIQHLKGNEPLFDVSFNYTHFHVYEELEQLAGVSVVDAKAYIQTHFALRVEFNQDPFTKHLTLDLEANLDALPLERLVAIGGYFRRALEAIVASPDEHFAARTLLGDDEAAVERRAAAGALVERPAGAPGLYVATFERRASEWPDRIAAVDASRSIGYRALLDASRTAAAQLRARGVRPGDIVALLADRSIDYLTAILGLWRVGAAFVPLPDGPAERIDALLERARAAHLVVARGHASVAERLRSGAARIALDALAEPADAAALRAPAFEACADTLAYVIFTSGSTGEPKGVMIDHGGMINHIEAKIEDLGIGAADIVSQDAAATFDICVWQFCAPLIAGAQVRIYDDAVAKDPARLLERVVADGVSILEVSPSVLSTMLLVHAAQPDAPALALGASALRWVVSSGETLQPSLVHQLRAVHPRVGILNMWGATETSDDCTHYKVPFDLDARAPKISIGRPIKNAAVYVLDPWGRTVPAGTPGELYVGGVCVGLGYLNDPQRTAAAYSSREAAFAGSHRLYRSGDRGWRAANGELFFIGRRDNQVKIRGHRIEIGEVEAALNREPSVQEAVVLALPDATGQLSLAAWAVPADLRALEGAGATSAWASALRKQVKLGLPAYMIPDVIVALDRLPKNVNGKVDRKALALPDDAQTCAQLEVVAPGNDVEAFVVDLFRQILKRPAVSADWSFFDIGGNSLLATQVVSRARRHFRIDLPIRALFEHDTAISFAAAIAAAQAEALREDTIAPQGRPEHIPLSFNQERLWFLDKIDASQRAYGSHFALRIDGPLDVDTLAWVLQRMTDRHEILRTRFATLDNQPCQVVAPEMTFPLAVKDLSGERASSAREALDSAIESELSRPFRLDALPLCSATIYRLSDNEHVLLWRNHHIIGDGWSAGVILREIEQLYPARRDGRAAELPPLPIQFADYAIWQRRFAQSEPFKRQLDFWRGYLDGYAGVLQLPTDFERPDQPTFDGRRIAVALPAGLVERVHAFSRASKSTVFVFLQTALGLLLSRYAKQGDLVLGTAVANRSRIETEPLIGFLTNTLPVRQRFDPSASFAAHLARVRDDVLNVFDSQDVTFAHLVQMALRERDPRVNPLVQVMFVLQNEDLSMPQVDGLRIAPVELDRAASILDLLFDLREEGGAIVGHVEYNVNLFRESTIRLLWAHLSNLIGAIVDGGDVPVSQLSSLGDEERRLLTQAWRSLQHGRSEIEFWHRDAAQTPHWDAYLEAAERDEMLMSAYMAISEY